MATRLSNGSIQMSDGRLLFANSVILAADLAEIMPLFKEPPVWPFVSGGGGGGAPGPQGLPGPSGPPGPECIPARTLFVAKSWPAGCDPLVYFTSISPALVQAATLSPTVATPVAIQIYPGRYIEDITLVSNVSLSSVDHLGAIIDGDVSWTPGAGPNAPQTLATEFPTIRGCLITGTISIVAVGKTAGFAVLEILDSQVTGGTSTITGRGLALDILQMFGCLHLGGLIVATDSDVRINDSFILGFLGSLTAFPATIGSAVLFGGQVSGPTILSGSYPLFATGVEFIGTAFLSTGAFFSAHVSVLFAGVSTADPGSSADIKSSEYFSSGALVGPGAIDRTLFTMTFGPTAVGPNPVVFSVPYAIAVYNVCLTDTGAGGGGVPAATTKLASGFTLVDPVGGRTFEITVFQV